MTRARLASALVLSALVLAFVAGVAAGVAGRGTYDAAELETARAREARERARTDACVSGWANNTVTTKTIEERADRWAELVDNLPPCLEQAPRSRRYAAKGNHADPQADLRTQ